jgi:hypothetical protein
MAPFEHEGGRLSGRRVYVPLVKVVGGSRGRVRLACGQWYTFCSHWFGRQLICPGSDCPACGVYAERVSTFLLCTQLQGQQWHLRVLELGQQSWQQLQFLAHAEGWPLEPGLELELSRGRQRSALRVEPIGPGTDVKLSYDDPDLLFDALVVLLRWPPRRRGEPVVDYSLRVRPRLIADLEASIVGAPSR